MNENNKLLKKAQDRVKSAKIVFTTCAGAGLGILRKVNFEIAIIDEASQITEACALIPLVKGCKKAVLVGDQYVFTLLRRFLCSSLICNRLVSNSVRWFETWRKHCYMMSQCSSGFTRAQTPKACPKQC